MEEDHTQNPEFKDGWEGPVEQTPSSKSSEEEKEGGSPEEEKESELPNKEEEQPAPFNPYLLEDNFSMERRGTFTAETAPLVEAPKKVEYFEMVNGAKKFVFAPSTPTGGAQKEGSKDSLSITDYFEQKKKEEKEAAKKLKQEEYEAAKKLRAEAKLKKEIADKETKRLK